VPIPLEKFSLHDAALDHYTDYRAKAFRHLVAKIRSNLSSADRAALPADAACAPA
jgi:hypothetical protein